MIKYEAIGYDFMASGSAHNLYQLGFILEYKPVELYLDYSSKINELAEYYGISYFNNLLFDSKFNNILNLLSKYNSKSIIHIIGANLKFLCFFFFISFFFREKIHVHLHGQVYGFKTSIFKRIVWTLLSFSYTFHVSNPAFLDTKIFHKLKNLNALGGLKIRCLNIEDKSIFLWSNRGVETLLAKNIFTKKGYTILPDINTNVQLWLNYREYISCLSKCKYIHIGFYDDYYLYSPSGRLSEAIIHDKTIIISEEMEIVETAINICNKYKLDYIVI